MLEGNRIDIWAIELVSLLLFSRALYREWRVSDRAALLLILAFIYGLVLEILNMFVFETYHYHRDFLRIFGAPVVIGLLWGLALLSSMKLTDALGVSPWAKPFSDGALCVLIDIAMDAVAIRLQYWTWTIPLHEGFFGVPSNNLFAWICVAFCFSACARILWTNGQRSFLYLAPPCAYVLLFILFIANGLFEYLVNLQTEEQKFMVFWSLWLVCFLIMLRFRKPPEIPRRAASRTYAITRLIIHMYFLVAYFLLGLFETIPLLLVIALLASALEVLIHLMARFPRGIRIRNTTSAPAFHP